jgi:hemoglobin
MEAQPGAEVDDAATMPSWGWGETKGPYLPT